MAVAMRTYGTVGYEVIGNFFLSAGRWNGDLFSNFADAHRMPQCVAETMYCARPLSVGHNGDGRILGFGLKTLKFEKAQKY